ncbi:MAG TPA: hypothetical protein VD788_17900 [Candidatus Polarisedimenticolaceae bacterium]|nr:hypothetical protein [Candidatus Polarisedimenticolaceae bacterium]
MTIRGATPARIDRRRLIRGLGRRRAALLFGVGSLAADLAADAYLVGGGVRDLLLDRRTTDLDLAIEGDAREVGRRLARVESGEYREHASFGTASVTLADGVRVDLAGTRCERYPRPGELPRVAPSGLLDDLARRDFTVNSMALSLRPERFGRLVDPYDGADDLRRGRLRVLHSRSFEDDPTRVARAMRLAARLGFRVEPATRRWMDACLGSGALARLSAARRRREVELLFAESGWRAIARTLHRHRAWSVIDRAVQPPPAAAAQLARIEHWYDWLTALAGFDPPPRWIAALVRLTRDGTSSVRRDVVQRLAPDRHARAMLLSASVEARALLARLRSVREPHPSTVLGAAAGISEAAWLEALDRTRAGRTRGALVDFLRHGRGVRLDISGHDLERAGIPRGPRIAVGLAAALAAKIDGNAADRHRELEVALVAARRA